jgi:hypothetical protein
MELEELLKELAGVTNNGRSSIPLGKYKFLAIPLDMSGGPISLGLYRFLAS